MIRASITALLLLGLTSPVLAEDSRLVEKVYDAAQVFRIDGRAKVQATIRFSDSEQIENVAIGDSQSWQVTPNKRANLLFVKPLQTNAVTNMTVVTNRRTYFFDLVASPRSEPIYVLSFRYPDEEAAQAEAEAAQLAARETASKEELAAASDPYAVVDPARLNFEWASSGDRSLLPERTYDDGEATFLLWPAGTAVPAILITDHEGTEGPVNFTVRGDTVVVEGVPSEIILRSGKDRAILRNEGPVRTPAPAHKDAALARADRPSKESR